MMIGDLLISPQKDFNSFSTRDQSLISDFVEQICQNTSVSRYAVIVYIMKILADEHGSKFSRDTLVRHFFIKDNKLIYHKIGSLEGATLTIKTLTK
jgi:hypothetical protein